MQCSQRMVDRGWLAVQPSHDVLDEIRSLHACDLVTMTDKMNNKSYESCSSFYGSILDIVQVCNEVLNLAAS